MPTKYTIDDLKETSNKLFDILSYLGIIIGNPQDIFFKDIEEPTSGISFGAILKVMHNIGSGQLELSSISSVGKEEKKNPKVLTIKGAYENKISEALKQNLSHKMSLDKRKSYLTPERRFIATGDYIPGKEKQGKLKKRVVIAVDCSGSMKLDKVQSIVNNCVTTVNTLCASYKNYSIEVHFFTFSESHTKTYHGIITNKNQITELEFDNGEAFEKTAKQFKKYCPEISLLILLSDYAWTNSDLERLQKVRRQYKTLPLNVHSDF